MRPPHDPALVAAHQELLERVPSAPAELDAALAHPVWGPYLRATVSPGRDRYRFTFTAPTAALRYAGRHLALSLGDEKQ